MAFGSAAQEAAATDRFPVAALWAGLTRRQIAEMAVPGALIGLLGGLIAGFMAAVGGLSAGLVVIATVALAVPLALAGAGYDLLLARGRVPLGPLATVALYWVVAFPLARVIHAAMLNLLAGDPVAVPHGWLDFVVYNMLLSVGFAIGFWWLHQSFAPRWWFHLRERNPVARHFIEEQLKYVGVMYEQQRQQRDQRRARRRTG
jgi:hypothetical protein